MHNSNHSIKKASVGLLKVSVLALIAAVSSPAFAEKAPLPPGVGHTPIIGHLPPVQLDPSKVEITPHGGALPFRPFQIVDPNTGNGDETKATPVSRSTLIKLRDGRMVPAGTFWDQANQFEQHVNQYGYTIRDHAPAPRQLSHTKLDAGKLEQQKQFALTHRDPLHVDPVKTPDQIRSEHVADMAELPATLKNIEDKLKDATQHHQVPKDISYDKSWDESWGSNDLFAATASTSMSVKGTSDVVEAKATSSAGVYVFGDRIEVVRTNSNYSAPRKGHMKGDQDLYFLGSKVDDQPLDSAQDVPLLMAAWSQNIDESTTVHVTIGPFPIGITVGAKGSILNSPDVVMRPLKVKVLSGPEVDLDAYAQAGLDIYIAAAGIGGTLKILSFSPYATTSLAVKKNSQNEPYYDAKLSLSDTLNVLQGTIYAYVSVDLLFWSDQWNLNLFTFNGIVANGTIFSTEDKKNLF